MQRGEALRILNKIVPMEIRARFEAADAFAREKCIEQAKAQYDYIIATFVGSNYAAYRQRAEISLLKLIAP